MSEFSINLVFDNFDKDGNPIPNGSYIPKIRASHPNHWHKSSGDLIDNDNIKTKLYHINDVTTDDLFYYIIHYNINLKDIIYESFIVSEEAIECCKNKNLKILFVTYHEVNTNEFEVLQQMIKHISNFGLDEDNFYYINNNSRLEEYRNILNSKIHTHTATHLFELIASRVNFKKSIFKKDKEFLFSCHNRLSRRHRIETLCFLKKYDILKNTDWTHIDPDYRIEYFEPGELTGYFSFVADEIDYFKKIGLKYSKYEDTKIDSLKLDGGGISLVLTEECFTNSYINIITETYFESPEVHITEKSFRSFYYMQLPIFVATYEHLAYLRKQFGFDMFDDLIDHSYDLEKDHLKRMKMVLEEIKRLNDNKDLVIDFYKNNKDRFEKNLNLFKNIYKQNQTINFFKKLANKNINVLNKMNDVNLNEDGLKIYHDILAPNKCGTRYLKEYLLLNTNSKQHNNYSNNSISIKNIWNQGHINWIIIRHPEEYLESALKTDLLYVWENSEENNIVEPITIDNYISKGTNHYINNLYKTLYSYTLNHTNVKFVFLKDLSYFCLYKFPNKVNYKYDSAKYEPYGNMSMDKKTIIEYVKEFYPSQWDDIRLNLKKEIFFYNKIIENCIFFNKISNPPIADLDKVVSPVIVNEVSPQIITNNVAVVTEVIEKNSWLKTIK
jgi:hypothetical protein